MRKCLWNGAALGALALAPNLAGQYAGSVVSYNPGTGAAAGYDVAGSALGEPSRITEHQFGGPVDPFNPAWLNSQVVSIGAGGSLTLGFGAPIRNDAANPFGLDFIVYGNSGFEYNFETGTTAGNLFFPAAAGSTRVSVSADNVTYFTLDSSLAPTVDRFFPTDGAGAFGVPVNPSLANASSFSGMTLNQIRALYAGSAGGAGYDLAWARDTVGNAVALGEISFVRFDVLSGAAEIDGVAAVPEPGTIALFALGGLVYFLRRRA